MPANFTAVNGSVIGSNAVTMSGTAGISGGYAVPLVDSDQVNVTASVAASITFDLDTESSTDSLNFIESAAPYSVALGTITTSDTRVSGTTDGVNYIMFDLDTNASGGCASGST